MNDLLLLSAPANLLMDARAANYRRRGLSVLVCAGFAQEAIYVEFCEGFGRSWVFRVILAAQ